MRDNSAINVICFKQQKIKIWHRRPNESYWEDAPEDSLGTEYTGLTTRKTEGNVAVGAKSLSGQSNGQYSDQQSKLSTQGVGGFLNRRLTFSQGTLKKNLDTNKILIYNRQTLSGSKKLINSRRLLYDVLKKKRISNIVWRKLVEQKVQTQLCTYLGRKDSGVFL